MARTVLDAAIVLDTISLGQACYADATGWQRLDGTTLLLPTNLTDWDNLAAGSSRRRALDEACHILSRLGATVIEASLSADFIKVESAEKEAYCTMVTEFVHDLHEHLKTFKQ